MTQLKWIPLILLIVAGLGVGVVYGHTFSNETVFLSDVAGGNITFALNFTATTYTVADNQVRFTVLEMDGNGTFGSLGFRNPFDNATLQVTNVGPYYVAFQCNVSGPTVFEVWLPLLGEPDFINGESASAWGTPTLDVTMNNNGTVVLEWDANGLPSNIDSLVSDMTTYLFILGLIVLVSGGVVVYMGVQTGSIPPGAIVGVATMAVAVFLALLVWVSMTRIA